MRFLFDLFLGDILRLFGVSFLYVVNAALGTPRSFKVLWNAESDKGDDYMIMKEKTGQKIAGVIVIGIVLAICFALSFLLF